MCFRERRCIRDCRLGNHIHIITNQRDTLGRDNVIEFKRPAKSFNDPLTEIIRNGAREILKEALEVEIQSFVEQYQALKTDDGDHRITRNVFLPERKIVTGIGEVDVKVPRARDLKQKEMKQPIRFESNIIPP